MKQNFCDIDKIKLTGVFYVDELCSQKHAHMLHKHNGVLELLYIASGEGRYIVGNREYAIKEGDLVICNADTLHGEAPFQNNDIQTYCCALANVKLNELSLGRLLKSEQKPVFSLEQNKEIVLNIMSNIHNLYEDDKVNLEICQYLVKGLLLFVEKIIEEHNLSSRIQKEQKNETLIRKITEYLNCHYMEQLTLKNISEKMHISETYLSHLFKRETGLSPIQYVIHRRIGEAQTLLMETDLPINKVEEMLGFSSSCHLITMFRKYVGLSPREYRKHFIKERMKKDS